MPCCRLQKDLCWDRKMCWSWPWLGCLMPWQRHPCVFAQGMHPPKWCSALWAPRYVNSTIIYGIASTRWHLILSSHTHFRHRLTVSAMLLLARNAVWSINMLLYSLVLLEAHLCLSSNSSVRLSNAPRMFVPLSTPRLLPYLSFSKSENALRENVPILSQKTSCTSLTWGCLFC